MGEAGESQAKGRLKRGTFEALWAGRWSYTLYEEKPFPAGQTPGPLYLQTDICVGLALCSSIPVPSATCSVNFSAIRLLKKNAK